MILKAAVSPLSRIVCIATPLLVLSLSSQAADSAQSLSNCQALTDRAARFECYDKAESLPKATIPAGATQSTIPAKIIPQASSAAANTATVTASTAKLETVPEKKPFYKRWLPFGWGDDKEATVVANNSGPQAPAAAPDSTVSNFGLSNKSASANSATVATKDGGVKELADTVAEVKLTGHNSRTVTLSSGQVWRQMYDQSYELQPGDKITIRPSGWGTAYRLYCDRLGGFIQVKRVDQ